MKKIMLMSEIELKAIKMGLPTKIFKTDNNFKTKMHITIQHCAIHNQAFGITSVASRCDFSTIKSDSQTLVVYDSPQEEIYRQIACMLKNYYFAPITASTNNFTKENKNTIENENITISTHFLANYEIQNNNEPKNFIHGDNNL